MKINLIEYFEATVGSHQSKNALVDENGKLTFSQLKKHAQNIAHSIIVNSGAIRQPVAVYLPKSNDAVASFLGIMYSGNICTPLDTKNPIKRIQSTLDILKPSCLLVNNKSICQIENVDLGMGIKTSVVDAMNLYKRCLSTLLW